MSKQGYHRGSVLITCPSCRNRHVISDNLNIFGDRKITVEDLLREKGQLVKRGTLGEDGDIEFWEDTPTDPADAGGAGAASVEGRAGEDDATRVRETRDPSSRATDPAPSSASVLPGNTTTRPSMHNASHQSPAPSTRRQFHAKIFKTPDDLKSTSPLSPPNQSFVSKYAQKAQNDQNDQNDRPSVWRTVPETFQSTSSAAPTPDKSNEPSWKRFKAPEGLNTKLPLKPSNQALASKFGVQIFRPLLPESGDRFDKPRLIGHPTIRHVVPTTLQSTSSAAPNPEVPLWVQKMVEKRERKRNKARMMSSPGESKWEDFASQFGSGRRNDPRAPGDSSEVTSDEPPKFTGARFIVDRKGTTPGPTAVQLEPGVVLRNRPPGGVPRARPDGPRTGPIIWRPSNVPIVSANSTPGDSVAGDSLPDDSSTR